MRILYICSHSPFGPQYGAQLRTLHIARALQRVAPVSVAFVSWMKPPDRELAMLSEEFNLLLWAPLIRASLKSVQDRIRREFDPRCVNTDAIGVSAETAAAVAGAVDQHDVVWIHTLRLANAFNRWQWPHSVLDVDDLMSGYWREESRRKVSLRERARTARFVWQWRRRERFLLDRFTVASVCSAADRRTLGDDPRIHVVRNGFEPPKARTIAPEADRPRLGLIGTFKYPPNVDGLHWFLGEVWPAIVARAPNVELRLVGDGSDNPGIANGPNVTGLGYVDDPADEIRTWSGMIVPLRIGGGTRVKIAEGFARGCPVISTSLGAFGYNLESGREMLIADAPRDFADACVKILNDAGLRERLARTAAEYFDKYASWNAIAPSVAQTVQACLDHSRFASQDIARVLPTQGGCKG